MGLAGWYGLNSASVRRVFWRAGAPHCTGSPAPTAFFGKCLDGEEPNRESRRGHDQLSWFRSRNSQAFTENRCPVAERPMISE